MALRVHRAERSDRLADGLAELLRAPLPDPFAPELVIVPARGVERWLSQRLSHRLGTGEGTDDGVCAGVELRSPRSLVAEVLGRADGPDQDPWSPDALVWPLLGVIDADLGGPRLRPLALHLGLGRTGEEAELRRGRRYAVARRLARLFTSYAEQRPLLLVDWESGADTDGAGGPVAPDLAWQPPLWRSLVAAVGGQSPVQRHREVVAALRADPDGSALPERLSLFGHTRLPVTEVELLRALGEHRDVHVWLPHPSPALWDALADLTGSVARADDRSHERVRHPLLASLGRDLRELERVLGAESDVVSTGATGGGGATGPATLLGWLQADLAANDLSSADLSSADRALAPSDRSVQVHACHGPARQVEVLREVLLGLLEDDPTLEPRDIIVMCPDIESYAPLVEAAFGLGDAVAGGHPGQRLPVRLADRSLVQTNPLLGVAGALLDLAGGRATASAVLDLLHRDPVRRRFALSDSDLDTITGWVEQAGIRWAYDAEHRAPYGLAELVQNTWAFGLDRVLAGVTMSEDSTAAGQGWVGATLPLDDVGSTSIDLAGRLTEALDRLRTTTDALTGVRPVQQWFDALREGVGALTEVARGEEWQSGQVQRELAGLAADAVEALDSSALELRLPDVRVLLSDRLAGRPTRANFRTGSLTVATLVPMRSVPHRVVCLLGLDDGVFPRSATVDGDDLLAHRPLTGERDPRSEDRQLLLDAVLAAGDHLVVTYTAADETTNRPRPPAVPLGELLDALDDTASGGREHAIVRHPLQDFDPRNFRGAGGRPPFSFDALALAGARAAVLERVEPPSLATTVLPPPAPDDVELDDLVRFVRHPVRAFLRDRLDVAVAGESEGVADGLPIQPDTLQEWSIGSRLLDDLCRGRSEPEALGAEWRRGDLPPGRLGWSLGKRLTAQAAPVAEQFHAITQGFAARSLDVDVDLGEGRRLRGTVGGLYGDRLLVETFSRLGPRQHLEAWIPLLALAATYPGRGWTAGAVGRGEKGRHGQPDEATRRVAFVEPDREEAVAALRDLVALRDAGLTEPLPLPLKTSWAWACERVEAVARARAAQKWESDRFPGENADPAHVAVWGAAAPLAVLLGERVDGQPTRLAAYAERLWRPLLQAVIG